MDFGVTRFGHRAPIGASAALGLFVGNALFLLLLGCALTLVGAAAELAFRAWGKGMRWRRALSFAALFSLLTTPGALAMGRELVKGEWISRQWFAPVIRYGVTFAALAGVAAVVAHFVWTEGRRHWPALWLLGCALLAALNGLLLVGYYAPLHVALYGLTGAVALSAFFLLLTRVDLGVHTSKAALVATVCVLAAAWGGRVVSPQTRELAMRSSPALRPLLPSFVPRADRGVLRDSILGNGAPLTASAAAQEPVRLGKKPKNLILIVVDTLRGDTLIPLRNAASLSAKDGDTPFFDQWLKSAYRFRNAYSQASRTNRSVPATLYSHENFEDASELEATPPALRARQLGLKPVAVVPEWYMLPNSGRAGTLVEGFDSVRTFLRFGSQELFVPLIKEALDEVGDKPFFLWLHYYGMHAPRFIGKDQEHPPSASEPERYRAALRYMDGRFEKVVAALRAKGKLDDTLIVLMADHGELLGERGLMHHGQGITEEEIHVPLAIWVPGAGSGTVDALAGNIDVIPTIVDLFGGANSQSMRGRSLVPEMAKLAKESDRKLYVASGHPGYLGLVTQRHVLRFEEKTGAFALFDRSDVAHDVNLFGKDPSLDGALVDELVRRNPAAFKAQLQEASTREALTARLEGPPRELSVQHFTFLLELAAMSQDPQVRAAAASAYERAPDPERKLAVVLRLHAADEATWGARATALLRDAYGRPEEITLVQKMTDSRVRGLEGGYVSSRLEELAEDCTSALNEAWLVLARKQGVLGPQAPAALGRQLDCALEKDSHGHDGHLGRALATIGELDQLTSPELENRIIPLLAHEDDWVAVTAVRALGSVGGSTTRDLLRKRLDTKSKVPQTERMVEGSILALARLVGSPLTPELLEWGQIGKRRYAVIRALAQVGDERSISFLKKKSKGPHAMNRSAAAALRTVRARLNASKTEHR